MLNKILHFKAFLIPVVFFIVLSVIASMNAPDSFSWSQNSLSTLGAQAFDAAWMMNAAWIGFGVLIILIAAGYHQKEDLPQALTFPIIVFGIAVILLGIWRYNNIFETVDVDVDEVEDHVIFYGVALISLTLSVTLHALLSTHKIIKRIHLMCALLLLMMMIILEFTTTYNGLFERVIWFIILVWLISMFGRVNSRGNINRL